MYQDSTLDIVAPLLKSFAPPAGPFDPQGAWRNAYTIYSVAATLGVAKADVAGHLAITRTPKPDGGALLEIDHRKQGLVHGSLNLAGRIQCAPGALAAPTEWDLTVEVHSDQKTDVLKKQKRDFPASAAYTSNWTLFDAVQRLPRSAKPLPFTLFDEWDLPKPNQSIAFRRTVELPFGKAHGFEQLGPGLLPLVYWTGDDGRLLFVVSGLLAYVMEGGKQ
jgi:hypothetical protein